MELRVLEYFVAVAEERSFTRAAERCHVAQPSLSHQIRVLEREIHEALFERRPREVRLTAAGQTLLPYARAAIEAVTTAKEEFSYRAGTLVGEIRMGFVDGIDTRAVARTLRRFRSAHPDVRLTILGGTSDDLLARVSDGSLEAAIVARPLAGMPAHVAARVVHREEIVCVRSAGDGGDGEGGRLSVKELADRPLITYNEASGVWPHILGAFTREGLTPHIVCATNDTALQTDLVREGLGVAVTAAADAVVAGVADLEVRGFEPPLELAKALVWRRHERPSRALAAFLEVWEEARPTGAA